MKGIKPNCLDNLSPSGQDWNQFDVRVESSVQTIQAFKSNWKLLIDRHTRRKGRWFRIRLIEKAKESINRERIDLTGKRLG